MVGSPGREVLKRCVSLLREQHHIHACIANGENAAGGFGLTAQTAEEMFESGVDFITGGNHIFDKRDFGEYLESSNRVIRPANYPPAVPGRGAGTFAVNGVTVGVLNLMGRTFMPPVDDPFRCADAIVADLRARTPVIIVDVHAEATSEKVALGRYLDGRVSCVFGTHTHVQTADEQILPGRNRLHQRPRDDGSDRRDHRDGSQGRARPVSHRSLGALQRAEERNASSFAARSSRSIRARARPTRSSASFLKGIA